MRRYVLDALVAGLILVGAGYLSAQQGPATFKGNGVTGVWSADQLCVSSTTKDSYIAEVGANDPGIYTNGTNCAAGTLRFDITSTTATYATSIQQVVQIGSTDSTTSTFYAHDIDSTLAAGAGNNTASLNGVIRGILRGANLTSTAVEQSAVHGVFFVTGTDASTWPKAAVIGEIHDTTTVADAAVMAVMGGDTTKTTALSAFGVRSLNSAGTSQFTYGLDLGTAIAGFESAAQLIKTADIRFSNGTTAVASGTAGIQFPAIGVGTPAVASAVTLASGYNLVLSGTGQVQLPDGTVTTPPISFTDIGLFGIAGGNGSLGIRDNSGSERARYVATGNWVVSSSGGYAFSSTTVSSGTVDNSITRNAANQWLFTNNGGTPGFGINSGVDGTVAFRNRAFNADAAITAGAGTFSSTLTGTVGITITTGNVTFGSATNGLFWTNNSQYLNVSNGVTQELNNLGTTFGRHIFGTNDATTNGASWNLNSGVLEAKTGDASAFTQIKGSTVNVVTGYQIAAAAATGTILRGNGTNYVASTNTFPDTAATGQVLIASATNVISAKTPATLNALPANQTGNATATLKMNGLGAAAAPCVITPASSGRVQFTISGQAAQTTTADGITWLMSYGTGAAPANAGAAAGTIITAQLTHTALTGALEVPFSLTGVATGLSLAATWFDLQVANVTGGTASITNVTCSAIEF